MSITTNKSNHDYIPAKVWSMPNEGENGGKFAATNRPTAGARHEQSLPVGDAPLQLYSLNTPNGIKVNIMLEELAECGVDAAQYDAYKIDIMAGDQFGSDFVDINPNSKIPALVDYSVNPPVKLFESGAILIYLAEKFAKFMPVEQGQKRAACLSWVMWQMGSAPYVGGGFGHFYAYAPYPMQYPIDRFAMETKRQLDVLDQHLANHEYLCAEAKEQGEQNYSIADMMVWAWYGQLVLGKLYDAAEFLDVASYKNVQRWAQQIAERPAVKRAINIQLRAIDEEK